MTLPSFFRLKGDTVVWSIFFALCFISLVEVFSATSMLVYRSGSFWAPFIRQGVFLAIGTVICIGTHFVQCRRLTFISALWPIIVGLLLLTILMGDETNGASRWLFGFQPSEFAKGILVATIALILSRCREGNGVSRMALRYVLAFTLPVVALIGKENVSTAVLISGVVYLMMFVAGIPRGQMIKLTLICAVLGGLGLLGAKALPTDSEAPFYQSAPGSFLKHRGPTIHNRVFGKSLVITPNPDSLVVSDKNMQVVHARIAVANNNHGLGLMPGNSVERDYLPQAYSDFIYAIIAEETGIWGASIVLLLYLVLLYRCGIIANRCGQDFPAFFVMGLGVLLIGQALLNMIVAVGLGPVTGQTLPLISRGGTSTLITCAYIGMIQSVAWSGLPKKKDNPAAADDQPQGEEKPSAD